MARERRRAGRRVVCPPSLRCPISRRQSRLGREGVVEACEIIHSSCLCPIRQSKKKPTPRKHAIAVYHIHGKVVTIWETGFIFCREPAISGWPSRMCRGETFREIFQDIESPKGTRGSSIITRITKVGRKRKDTTIPSAEGWVGEKKPRADGSLGVGNHTRKDFGDTENTCENTDRQTERQTSRKYDMTMVYFRTMGNIISLIRGRELELERRNMTRDGGRGPSHGVPEGPSTSQK